MASGDVPGMSVKPTYFPGILQNNIVVKFHMNLRL